MPRGIFRLKQVYEEQLSGNWTVKSDVWLAPSPYYQDLSLAPQTGYFGGGYPALSTVDRIDYSNDTATAVVKGPLSLARGLFAATGNRSFGYFGGGWLPTTTNRCDRIDYSNDTVTASIRGTIFTLFCTSAVGNNFYGYFAGGTPPGPSPQSYVVRVDYANDTATASPKGPLSLARFGASGSGNSSYGWIGGGNNGGYTTQYSRVDRIDYSNDTATASVRGPLTAARKYLGSTGTASYGWFGGGDLAPGATATSIVDRIDYSNDTATASPKGPLSVARSALAATGNSSFGYFGGGSSVSTVDRIDYSNDTAAASVKGPLSVARSALAASSARANALSNLILAPSGSPTNFGTGAVATPNTGYFGGGNTSTVDRIDYSNDTATASVKGPLSAAKTYHGATGNSSFGYFGGGYTPAFSPLSIVDRIDYSNDTTTASPKGPLSLDRRGLRATGNSSYGYFGGGFPGISTVDRIDYSNDTATAVAKGPLSQARGTLAATGNSSYGYFGGGFPGISIVDRIDYSNDTATAVAKGPFSLARHYLTATGDSSFGYFGGGGTPSPLSIVDRIDYSNDTATAVAKGPLSLARSLLRATGNSSFGYFGGGFPGISTVDRIDYSNDTATAAVKGPLSLARSGLAASSARANGFAAIDTTLPPANSPVQYIPPQLFGYFGGGGYPAIATIDRIEYSNDTVTSSVRGPLSLARGFFAATGNSSFGYFGGGWLPTTTNRCDRIDYANDTATASIRGPISTLFCTSAVGNNSYGYFAGGTPPGPSPQSYVVRVDYANDTATAAVKGPLSLARFGASGSGNSSYGWIGGGNNGGYTTQYSRVDRIDYSNDTATAVAKGPLTAARKYLGSTGTASYGWFGGGDLAPGATATSIVDRIDYSNDTVTASPKGPLSVARTALAATGNSSFGYFGGGVTVSTVDRIDYSNDTATASVKGPLSVARYGVAATSAAANGLPQ